MFRQVSLITYGATAVIFNSMAPARHWYALGDSMLEEDPSQDRWSLVE